MLCLEVVRAFLALDISDDIKGRLMELEAAISGSGADVKLVERENLHVTLKFLGDINAEMVEKVSGVAKSSTVGKFLMQVKGSGVFPNQKMPRVLWAGVGEGSGKVTSIFSQLDTGIAKLGYPEERNFTPHITVGRVKSLRNKDGLLEALNRFSSENFGEMMIDKIILKRSILSSSGPVYSNLKEVPLQG